MQNTTAGEVQRGLVNYGGSVGRLSTVVFKLMLLSGNPDGFAFVSGVKSSTKGASD